MLIGYNNDVEYRGKKFHIQTEDHGKSTAKIESQIFHEGQILDTEIIDYDSVLEEEDDDDVDKRLKSLLVATHKGLYKRLVSGEYDEMVGLDPVDEEEVESPEPEEFEPGQDRVPNAAMKVEEEGEEAFQQFHQNQAEKHVELDNIKEHLADVSSSGEEEVSAAEEQEPDSKVDEAFAGVESELEVEPPSEIDSEAESDDGKDPLIESRPTPPPETDLLSNSEISASSLSEESRSGVPSSVRKRSSGGTSRADGGRIVDIPMTGVDAWTGCDEPEGVLSIVSLVESFMEE